MTHRHRFFRMMQGHIYHVTGLQGLRGIIDAQEIRPNLDGSLAYNNLGASPDCYTCQFLGAVSLLDLRSCRVPGLFSCDSFQNWLGVFTYHRPSIALQLNFEVVKHGIVSLPMEEMLKLPGRFIAEAESCHKGAIPLSAVRKARVIGARYRLIADFEDVESAYCRARRICHSRNSRRSPRHAPSPSPQA